MENVEAYKVYVTKDYNMFKRLVGNRDVAESRVGKIINSITEVGWIKNPIIVNENMEIIDGQGRFTALQRLNLPIEYIIAEGTGNRECIHMNMDAVNWKLSDFVKSYAEQGNPNYQRFLALLEKYVDGNIDIISTALNRVSKSKHADIKQGTLRVTQEQFEKAQKRLDYIQPIWNEVVAKRLPGSIIKLMQTLIYYYDYPEVDKNRLARKVTKYIYVMNPWVLNEDCERRVEECYNYRSPLENKQSIAYLIKEERVRHKLELNKILSEKAYERTQKGVQGFVK